MNEQATRICCGVSQAAETVQLTFKKLEITACTCIENLYFYNSRINKQTGKGRAASHSIRQVNFLLLACRYLLNNCRLYTRYMHATIIQAIILGVILGTQMLSQLQEQQRQ